MRLVAILVLCLMGLLVLSPRMASAGCCLTGSVNLTDHVGYVILDTGTGTCTWHFDHCNISVYQYAYCEGGPDEVVSFRVHPSANCNFYSILCFTTIACGWVGTSQGQAYECTRTCAP